MNILDRLEESLFELSNLPKAKEQEDDIQMFITGVKGLRGHSNFTPEQIKGLQDFLKAVQEQIRRAKMLKTVQEMIIKCDEKLNKNM